METGRILECCLDEIALEGLVGINIASLWIRLDQRLSELPISVNIDNVMKGFLWQCITNSGDVKYYELDKPPPPIDPCLKFRQRDPEQGLEVVGEMTTGNSSEHIINDIVKGVKGVCTDYTTRKDVTQDIRENFIKLSDAVDRFGDRLVVVASQNLRNIALLGNQNDPEIEISDLHYAILECLGKSRYYGMLQTQIYTEFNFAAKNMFYQRKKLFRVIGCVTSQSYAVRLPGGRLQHSVLLMLKRFHVDYRSKYDVLSEKLSNLLKTKPDQMDVAVNVKCEMGLEYEASAFKKLLKYAFGLNFVKMVNVTKKVETAPDKSRTQTTKYLKLLKDYNSKDEAIVDDEEEEFTPSSDALPERVAQIHELPLLNQVYNIVEQHGSNGISLRTLQRMMNLGKVEIRQIGKNLLRTGTVACIPHDEGRQRTYRYVTVRNIASSQIQKDLDKAKKKSMILEMQKKGTSSVNDETGSLDLGDGSVHSTPCSTPSISPLPSAGNSRTNTPEPVEDNAAREMSDPGRSKGKMPLTTRVLKRRNIIIETVRTCRVVQGVFSLLKAVLSVEKDEGISYRCDKKSIVRLVKVLVQEGLIRQFTTIVASDDGSARNKVDFITDINIQPNDELVKSAIAQVKFRMENVIRHKQEKAEKRKQPSKAIKVTISSPKKSKKRKSDSSNDDDEREVSKTCKESPSTGKLSSVGSNGDEDKKTEEGAVRLERLKGTPGVIGLEARKYGYLPKMPRLKLIHSYIWYLVYGYRGKPLQGQSGGIDIRGNDDSITTENEGGSEKETNKGEPSVTEINDEKEKVLTFPSEQTSLKDESDGKADTCVDKETISLKSATTSDVNADDEKDTSQETDQQQMLDQRKKLLPIVFMEVINWRRFLPSLPRYNDCGEGWCLVSDLILRMPLSIFCAVVQLSFKVDNIEDYLSHPIKKHTLLADLPRKMRIQLLHRRKYIFSFDENLKRLSSMGLVIYGPQKSDTKDQVFIYVCRNATVNDTTSCTPHYNHIGQGPFARRTYHFKDEKDLEKYWFDLQCVCLSTPLGVIRTGRRPKKNDQNSNGKELTNAKILINTMKQLVVSVEDVSKPPLQDNGTIPGDAQGAGGMDSLLYAHLKRNWHWIVPKRDRPKKIGFKSSDLSLSSSPTKKPMADVLEEGVASTSGELTPDALILLVTETKRIPHKTVTDTAKKRKRPSVPPKQPTPRKKRKIAKPAKKRGPKDATDVLALEKMTKQRVGWTAHEDSLILLCKVASTLLNKKKKNFVPWSVVRDLLHDTYECSKDKTSAAVNRRSKYILNNPQTALNLKICLAETYEDKKLLKDIMKVKGNYFDPQVCAEEYVALVASMKEKFSSLPANLKFDLPETIDELYKQYKLLPVGQQINFDDKVVVRTRRDIVKAQLTNLIQISLLMDSSKYNSYQVFKIYEQYSTDLLESAFNTLRNRGLVNRKRAISGCKTTRHVPFAAMSYQLSAAYQRYFLSLMPASLFLEVKTFLQKLAKSTSDPKERWVEFPNEACGGIVCTMATLMTMKKMFFDVTVPEQIVVVDSDLMENKVLSSSKQTLSNVSSDSDDDDDDDDDDVIAPVPILPSPVKTHKSTEVVNTTTVQSQSISKDNLQEPIASTSGMQPAPLLSTSSVNSGPKPAPVASTSSVNSGTQPAPVASTSTVNSGTQSTSLPSTSTVNSQNPAFDVTPRQASRSNLLLYRGHYAPGIVSKRNLNPQDNIVVNACTILVTLTSGNDGVHTCIKCENKEQEQCLVDESEESLDCVKQLMCKSLSDMCNNSIVPSEKPQLDDVVNTCKDQGYSEPVLKMLVEIYNVIESKKEFGIATRDMYQHSVISRYGMSREIVETVIKLLQDKSLIIEAGISVPTLVSVHHASPWMIHSLKLKDNSSIPSDPIHPIQSKSDPVDAPTDTPRKGRSKEKETTSVETPTSFEEGVFEPVEFLSHPWHTVEGTANETSLASMLNGLMMTIMNSPGLSEKSLLHRYQGVLYPVSVKHLFKMLIDMGCITRLARVKRKCSLFSSPWQATPDIGAEEDIYYEPTVDGVLRLAAALHQ